MSKVNTVLGPIAAEELGFVAIHEHIGYGMPGSELDTTWWKAPEVRYEETVPKLRTFHENARPYGGATFVDTYTSSLPFNACTAASTRYVEPLVPGNPAAPVHPNARGMANDARVLEAAMHQAGVG